MKLVKFIFSLIATIVNPVTWGEPNEKVYDTMEDADVGINGEALAKAWGTQYDPNGRTPKTPEKDESGKTITVARSDDNYGKNKQETKSTEQAPEKDKPAAEKALDTVKEIQADENFTKDKAIETLKDFEDDDIVIIDGNKTTKAEYLKTFESPASPQEDETITLGTKELTPDEYAKVIEEAAKKFGWDENYVKNADENVLKQTLTDFLNLRDGSLSLNDRNQQVAKERRAVEAKALELNELYDRLEDEKKKLEDLKKKKQEILEADENAIVDDNERTKLISRKAAAEEKIAEIEEQLTENANKLKQVDINQSKNWFKTTHLEVLEGIPEFALDKPCWSVIDEMKKVENERELTDAEIQQLDIALAEWDFLNHYAKYLVDNPDSKRTVKTHFAINRSAFASRLPKAPAQSVKAGDKGSNKAGDLRQNVIKIITKQKQAVNGGGGSSSMGGKYDTPKEEGDFERDREKMIRKTHGVDGSQFHV